MKYFLYDFLGDEDGEVSKIIRCNEDAKKRYYIVGDTEFIFKTDDGYFFTNKSIHEVTEYYYYSFCSLKKLTKCQEMKLKKKIQKGN